MIDHSRQSILSYLEKMPGYPFVSDIDSDFVAELLDDFPAIDILEQIKAFRWHYAGRPANFKSVRPAIRRWLASARPINHEPF